MSADDALRIERTERLLPTTDERQPMGDQDPQELGVTFLLLAKQVAGA